MASLSSTTSVTSSNSLGNTSLRGFGGMVSGIQRDEIIEAMTLHTTNKIANQKAEITKLQWKQEAYRGLSDKILDLADNYNSYSSTKALLDPMTFARNMITVKGQESSTNLVTATGTSDLAANVSLAAVTQMATSTVRQSDSFGGKLTTDVNDLDATWRTSRLEGTQLVFGTKSYKDGNTDDPIVSSEATFKFQSTYKDEDGNTQTIDYLTTDYDKLAEQLTASLKDQDLTVNGKDLSDLYEFKYTGDRMQLVPISGTDDGSIVINKNSTALSALGYEFSADGEREKDGIDIGEYDINIGSFKQAYVAEKSALQSMTGQKLTFSLDGSEKEIELITKEEEADYAGLTSQQKLDKLAENLQKRLNQAYGTNAVNVSAADGKLSFETKSKTSSVSVKSSDNALLKNMGLEYGASSKVNLSGKLSQSAIGIDASQAPYTKDGELDLEINGVKIKGLTANSSISDILSKINSSEAGVKATYVDATGTFMLVSSETGEGREINLNSKLAQELFGQKGDNGQYDITKGVKGGQNAEIYVDYGNGSLVRMERASNTFNLEGMSVTVSGVFGKVDEKDENGVKTYETADPSAAVTFSAKADVDGVTEKVKSFFEDFNTLVKEINGHVTTRPDSSYAPLTDEQKAEMNETSIENWEKKAKEGLLYNDSTIRSLSMDVQNIFVELMNNGASYDDLKKIGITYNDDYTDGGTLVFDESAFKAAMESEPELVANIFTGGGSVSKGLMAVVDDTFTPYATRYASKNATDGSKGSYGQLIEIAGSEKKPTTLQKNQIYDQLKTMQEMLETLQSRLKTEQERYISVFTNMETMINQFNSQASYLSNITG